MVEEEVGGGQPASQPQASGVRVTGTGMAVESRFFFFFFRAFAMQQQQLQ